MKIVLAFAIGATICVLMNLIGKLAKRLHRRRLR